MSSAIAITPDAEKPQINLPTYKVQITEAERAKWVATLRKQYAAKLDNFPELVDRQIESYLRDPEIFEQETKEFKESLKMDKDGYVLYSTTILGPEDEGYAEMIEKLDRLAAENVTMTSAPVEAVEASCVVVEELDTDQEQIPLLNVTSNAEQGI